MIVCFSIIIKKQFMSSPSHCLEDLLKARNKFLQMQLEAWRDPGTHEEVRVSSGQTSFEPNPVTQPPTVKQ